MSAGRRSARRQAVFVLYQQDLLKLDVEEAIGRVEEGERNDYACRLIRGTASERARLDALIAGGAQFATSADVPIALAGLADQKVSVVATIGYSTRNIRVVARKDSGVYNPGDLKGKTIATTRGGGPLFFSHKFLKRYGMDVSEVNLISSLNPNDMVTARIEKSAVVKCEANL